MITESKKAFTTSINLKFDIGNKEFVQRYLPTPSHAEFLKGIIGGFLGERKNNAHIMIGPYGSGKSLAATIVADIFSRSINDQDFEKLIDKFKDVDQEIFEKLNAAKQSNALFIPVVLSGNEGPFNRTIINSIVKSVKSAGFQIDVPGEVEEIHGVLKNWESAFPKTLSLFKKSLKNRGYTLIQWKKELNDNNQKEIKWFMEEYSVLSAGAKFQVEHETNFIDKITHIIAQLKENNIKIFIAYDEFGRFLQSLEMSQIYKTMQDLQDLAEVAGRSENTLQLLLISHKNMSQYMLGHNEEFKAEFQRIEKRFKTYFVESDKATFYRIAQEYTKNMQKELMLLNLESADSKWILKRYNLFSELNHQETEKLIIEGSYPLHPLALFLLPRLSNVFGQNERTLFTFLESEETGGLTNFVAKHKEGMYYPHMLFDYFFQNSINEFLGDESFGALKTFAKITSKMRTTKQNKGQMDLLKLITLWELSSATNVVKLNDELLMFGTGQNLDELKLNLDRLVQQKMLRFNRILGQWELNEGSSVLVDELLNEERTILKVNNENRLDALKSLLEKKFYLATDYNDEINITRFMQVNILTSEQLLEEGFIEKIKYDADGYIYYVIPADEMSYSKSISAIASIKDKRIIFSVTDRELKSVRTSLDRLIGLESIYLNKKILSEHNRLEEEISVLLAETQFEIREFLKEFENFQENIKWFYEGAQLIVNHQVQLENKISEIMYEMYPYTPEIRNDSINRRNLNGMQTKAMYTVLNNVIKNPNFERLGIEGQGPDYLIYATVFKNNNLDVSNLNQVTYEPYRILRQSLLGFINNNKEASMLDLENIFTSHPFGIRKPLIPLLFAGLLRDIWEQLMFYRNGMYVTAVDADKLYGMFNEPAEYQFVFNDYSPEFLSFVKGVQKIFQPFESEYVQEQTIVIKASSGILNWLRQLPRHTQTTDKMDNNLLEFKNMVRKIEVNPINSLEKLQETFGKPEVLVDMKAQLEDHFVQFEVQVIDKLFKSFDVNSIEELAEKRKNFSADLGKRNQLLKSIDIEADNFIQNFALSYTGVELGNWSDTTFDLFERQMQNDYRDMEMSSDDSNKILLGYGDSQKSIKKVELSNKAKTVYENVNRIINNAGRSVPREEIEYLVFKLLDEYIE
ncbi:hypothetical protein [Planomicrobium sp. CPCC 101110]|uniref:hypothetical protein n=1 Tax=Planomicrobium sp. CPCC 101110 TaxID=2599619 RepID=UPI0011B6F4B1|nr:hypothetical protein [Planomicrobium sp. CPCC 101110]TWT27258.1 hypothetical protein FQV30_01695 [Planomicrobium sp. CPCC 101110]